AVAVIEQIGSQFGLNDKQWMVFRVIAGHFVAKSVLKSNDGCDQLTMLMMGPGGTGKTHVVKAVQAVMKSYGCAHLIRYLAPTGSAASLIKGMMVHKGLGLKIKSNGKGKGNRDTGESSEDYSVLISVQNRTLLRDEWKNVEYLLIDEVSLV
ncbi:hypothetical protein DFJ58DRAFT_644732, partial [Suillus subalutaceus]|uniref:uncharacterized protein n=1 Tax=Suillus subalutaceus TaxID=48586 RepID=UPI001B87DDB6